MAAYFVSFYPRIPMEENLSLFDSLDDPKMRELIEKAAGVVFPPYIPPWRYYKIKKSAKRWFPRLEARFRYRGKSSQTHLFKRLGVRHPETMTFDTPSALLAHFEEMGAPWSFPVVLKGDTGGGGSRVYPVYRPAELQKYAAELPPDKPALVQKWVEHGGRDLRVVVYGDQLLGYFRIGDGRFYNNVSRGGRIDYHSWPDQKKAGMRAVRKFCDLMRIDVAGFDLMFPDRGSPMFIEINFHFGHKGLGGTAEHHQYWLTSVRNWKARCLETSVDQ